MVKLSPQPPGSCFCSPPRVLLVFLFYPLILWALRASRPTPAPAGAPASVSLIVVVRNGAELIAEKLATPCARRRMQPSRSSVIPRLDRQDSRDHSRVAGQERAGPCRTAAPGKSGGLNRCAAAREGRSWSFPMRMPCRRRTPCASSHALSPGRPWAGSAGKGRSAATRKGSPRPRSATSAWTAGSSSGRAASAASPPTTASCMRSGKNSSGRFRGRHGRPLPGAGRDPPGFRVRLRACGGRRDPQASRSPRHEIERRRRIVSTSLRCIWGCGRVEPLRFGFFSFGLLVNKVLRRLLPLFLLGLLGGSLALAREKPVWWFVLLAQTAFYLLALATCRPLRRALRPGILEKAAAMAFYFCLGNYGTLLGLLDFLRAGR